jgi:adenosylcobinamide-GDP ribazoletransferase
MVALTGALHEDGLADSADGLWGGWTVQRRLEIMKDSRVGTYGVIALVLSLGLRWAALTTLAAAGGLTLVLIAAGVLSRAPMLAIMGALPHARSTGLSATVGRPGSDTVLLGLGLSGLAGFALLGFGILPLAALLFVTTLAIARIAKARIDGQTGDILGATQQISEIAILVYLAA